MVKVIAEIGINHQSSEDITKKLIDHAKHAGCWAIKFQYRNLNDFYSDTTEIGDELIFDQLKNTDLSLNQIISLNEYAQESGLKTGISFFNIKDLKEIVESNLNYDFLKIPSAEFSNTDLINSALKYTDLLILSTGGHTLEEIKTNIKKHDLSKKEVVIMHCTSNYPTEIGNQNLKVITELLKIKDISVGYSSHDKDYQVNLIAAALGAKFIERHITLNKEGRSLDDSSSSELGDFVNMNNILNNFQKIMGDSLKPVNQGEKLNLQNLGTCAYSDGELEIGDKVDITKVSIKAPRKGLTIDELKRFIKKPLIKKLYKNQPITKSHFVKPVSLNHSDFEFMENNKISIPLRFHDMQEIFENFNISNFEFHLSYHDVDEIELSKLSKNSDIFQNKTFSFHLPDYINNYQLFDPLSDDKEIQKRSKEILNKTIDIRQIFSPDSSIFVSSLSQNTFDNKRTYYENLKEFIEKIYTREKISFLPQWLPKKAWYFGGSYEINQFSQKDDIELINEFDMDICLDVAHLIMSANSANENWKNWFELLVDHAQHIHLSDSYGTDGEGVEFGKGELGTPIKILELDCTKVLEVWQGHLNDFDGFKIAVKELRKRN